jgi:hypothetical protein
MTTLQWLYNLMAVQHPVLTFIVFSNIVSFMPSPLPGSRWYAALFGLLHAAAANAGRVLMRTTTTSSAKAPGGPTPAP